MCCAVITVYGNVRGGDRLLLLSSEHEYEMYWPSITLHRRFYPILIGITPMRIVSTRVWKNIHVPNASLKNVKLPPGNAESRRVFERTAQRWNTRSGGFYRIIKKKTLLKSNLNNKIIAVYLHHGRKRDKRYYYIITGTPPRQYIPYIILYVFFFLFFSTKNCSNTRKRLLRYVYIYIYISLWSHRPCFPWHENKVDGILTTSASHE